MKPSLESLPEGSVIPALDTTRGCYCLLEKYLGTWRSLVDIDMKAVRELGPEHPKVAAAIREAATFAAGHSRKAAAAMDELFTDPYYVSLPDEEVRRAAEAALREVKH